MMAEDWCLKLSLLHTCQTSEQSNRGFRLFYRSTKSMDEDELVGRTGRCLGGAFDPVME